MEVWASSSRQRTITEDTPPPALTFTGTTNEHKTPTHLHTCNTYTHTYTRSHIPNKHTLACPQRHTISIETLSENILLSPKNLLDISWLVGWSVGWLTSWLAFETESHYVTLAVLETLGRPSWPQSQKIHMPLPLTSWGPTMPIQERYFNDCSIGHREKHSTYIYLLGLNLTHLNQMSGQCFSCLYLSFFFCKWQ